MSKRYEHLVAKTRNEQGCELFCYLRDSMKKEHVELNQRWDPSTSNPIKRKSQRWQLSRG